GQRLVENAGAVLVLGADREVRVEQGRALPPQRLEGAAAAALRGLVHELGLGRARHAGRGQDLGGEGGGESHRRLHRDEGAPAQSARLDMGDQLPQLTLIHQNTSVANASVAEGSVKSAARPRGVMQRSNGSAVTGWCRLYSIPSPHCQESTPDGASARVAKVLNPSPPAPCPGA